MPGVNVLVELVNHFLPYIQCFDAVALHLFDGVDDVVNFCFETRENGAIGEVSTGTVYDEVVGKAGGSYSQVALRFRVPGILDADAVSANEREMRGPCHVVSSCTDNDIYLVGRAVSSDESCTRNRGDFRKVALYVGLGKRLKVSVSRGKPPEKA